MTRRIADDPERMKWCSRCERQKPVTEYHKATGGWPQAECKACHRVVTRENKRKVYARRPAWRRKELARVAAYYWTHAEERRAYSRAWHQARKVYGAA